MEEDQLIQDLLTKSGKEFTEQDVQDIKTFYGGDTDRMIGDILTKSGKEFEEEDISAIKTFYNIKGQTVAVSIPTESAPKLPPIFGPTLSTGEGIKPETGELTSNQGLEVLENAIYRGAAQADLSSIGIDAINLQEGKFTEEQIGQIIEANKKIESVPLSEEAKAVGNATTFAEGFKAWAKAPIKITTELFTQSMTSFLKNGLKTVIGGAAVGAATGAGVGVVAGGVGAIPGAIVGSTYGALAGMGVSSYQLEAGQDYIGSLTEAMAEGGLDPQNPKDWQKMFENEEVLKSARDKAVKRGLTIALFDVALGKLAGVVAGAGKSVGRTLSGAGIEFASEGAGEASAQLITEGEISPGEIIAETAGGGGGPVATTIQVAGKRAQSAIDNKRLGKTDNTPLVEAVVDGQESNVIDEIELSETIKEISLEESEALKAEVQRFSELKNTIPEDLSNDQKKEILSLIDKRDKLKEKPLDPAFEESRDKEVEALNEEITKVSERTPESQADKSSKETEVKPTTPFIEDFKLQNESIQIDNNAKALTKSDIEKGNIESVPMNALEAQNTIKNQLDKLQKLKDCL